MSIQTYCLKTGVGIFKSVCKFVQAKSPWGRPAWIALVSFYQPKACCVYSQKPSNRILYPGVFCDILRLFELSEESKVLTEGLYDDRIRDILQKKVKVPTLPV